MASEFKWGGLSAGFLVLAYTSGSLMVTTVLPRDEGKARALLNKVADAVVEFRDERQRWPTDLEQVDSSIDLSYRWRKVEYDVDKKELWPRTRIPIEEPDLAFRLTYGLQGRTEHIDSIGHSLE